MWEWFVSTLTWYPAIVGEVLIKTSSSFLQERAIEFALNDIESIREFFKYKLFYSSTVGMFLGLFLSIYLKAKNNFNTLKLLICFVLGLFISLFIGEIILCIPFLIVSFGIYYLIKGNMVESLKYSLTLLPLYVILILSISYYYVSGIFSISTNL